MFSEVLDLTGSNWGHYIDKADPGEIWLVLFYRDGSDRAGLIAGWDEAFRRLKGIVKMARVNVESERYLTMQMRIRYEPTIAVTVTGGNFNWRFHTGAITTDSVVALASEIYQGSYFYPLETRAQWDSVVSNGVGESHRWRLKLVIVSDTSRPVLKYRHLATVLDSRAEVYYITTWTHNWISRQVQQLLELSSPPTAPFIFIIDDTAGKRQERFRFVSAGSKSWSQLDEEISGELKPLFPPLNVDNYMRVCRAESTCILLGLRGAPSDLLRQFAASMRAVSDQFGRDVQFGWFEQVEGSPFVEAFGLDVTASSIVFFDRSVFEVHVVNQKEANLRLAEVEKGNTASAAAKLANYFKNTLKFRSSKFTRVSTMLPFMNPTWWMRATSWKAIGTYFLVAIGYFGVRRLISRVSTPPPKKPGSKKPAPPPPTEEDSSDEKESRWKSDQRSKESKGNKRKEKEPDDDQNASASAESSSSSSSETKADRNTENGQPDTNSTHGQASQESADEGSSAGESAQGSSESDDEISSDSNDENSNEADSDGPKEATIPGLLCSTLYGCQSLLSLFVTSFPTAQSSSRNTNGWI